MASAQEVAGLRTTVGQVQQALLTMEQRVATLKGEKDALAAELTSTKAELATARAETAGLNSRVVAIKTESDDLRTRNSVLESVVSAGFATLPDSLKELKEMKGGKSEEGLIDKKGIGKPAVLTDKEEKFPAWVRKVKNFVLLEWAEEAESPLSESDWAAEFGDISGSPVENLDYKVNQLYGALSSLTGDESNEIVTNSGEGNGLEAWRRLHRRWDPSTGGRTRNLLKTIISPPKVTLKELSGALVRWMQQIHKYEKRKDDAGNRVKVPEDVKMAAIEMMAPEDIENHLILTKYRIKTFDEMYSEVTSILEARTGVKIREPSIRGTGAGAGTDMDVDPLLTLG